MIGIPNQHRAWTPRALGSSLLGWWRADMGITLVSGVVSAWADQSGNGNHLVQSTANRRPAYSTAHADWNGRPALTWDGVLSAMATITNPVSSRFDMFIVCRPTTSNVLVAFEPVAEYLYTNPCCVLIRGGVSVRYTANHEGVPVTTWQADAPAKKTIRWRHNGTHASHKVAVNEVDLALSDSAVGNPSGTVNYPLSLFNAINTYPVAASCPEVVWCNRMLTDAEATVMSWYLKRMYAHY
jgi:hypothetical protein